LHPSGESSRCRWALIGDPRECVCDIIPHGEARPEVPGLISSHWRDDEWCDLAGDPATRLSQENTLTSYSPEVAEHGDPFAPLARPALQGRLTKLEFFLIAFVIASFAYEIPLVYVTNFYKVNPYLFDVAAVMLFCYWLLVGRAKGWRLSLALRNPLVLPWLVIVGTFFWATLVSATWVPTKHYAYSLFYFAKYVEGLAVLLIVLAAPLDERAKRRLLWVALLGGTWVAFYAVLQFFGIVGTTRVIPKGFEVLQEGKGIFSTLGTTYFHAGWFSVISTLIGVTIFVNGRGLARLAALVITPFCAIPAVVSGTRAALFGLGIATFVFATGRETRRYLGTWVLGMFLAASINFFYSQSITMQRIERIEETGGRQSPQGRLINPLGQIVGEMTEHFPIMAIAGGGFYVVPRHGKWRHGYGIHNIFVRPLEQAGILSFVASIWLWIRLGTHLGRRRRTPAANALDERFRFAMFSFFVALLVVGWGGQTFWLDHGTEHLGSYMVLLFGLALTETGGPLAERDPSRPVYEGSELEPLTR